MNKGFWNKVGYLPNERVIVVFRHSWLIYYHQWLVLVGYLSVLFFLMFFLLYAGNWGRAIFIVGAVIGFYYVLRILWCHLRSYYLLTNIRLVNHLQVSFLNRQITQIFSERILSIKVEEKGIINNIFHTGDVTIFTTEHRKIVYHLIKKPDKVALALGMVKGGGFGLVKNGD
ncbi:MAG: hypothetical protein WCL61_03575 [bacterium]